MFFGGGGGFPFPGMEGGMPGGGRGGKKKDVDTDKFYKLLEVDKNANDAEIKKAYRKLAVKHHPDKGGDPEKFKEISKAYETLSNSEKRAKYDRFGEEGLDGDGPGGDPSDIFEAFFGGGGRRGGGGGQRRRQKTKDVVQPLQVTLEQIYNGQTKKMAITRKVIDKKKGVQTCDDCGGRGVKVEVVRMGPMIQQMQSECRACGGQGKSFQTKSEREILEVHIQKGSPDGHKMQFREMADEHPDADTGDVIFVVKEKEHPEIKRKGADLFIERNISLSEALCGFKMEFTHLDGRKLLIKTTPGDIIKPLLKGFDPLATASGKMEWEKIDDHDCTIESSAQAEMTDPEVLKKACETQLKRQGVDVGCFVIDNSGKTHFKSCTREEALQKKKAKKGHTMYVLTDPNAENTLRVMKAVKGEGMPTYKNPFLHGNLFLILNIEFPEKLDEKAQAELKNLLPPALLPAPQFKGDDFEEHFLKDIDPVASFNENKINMQAGNEAYDDDDDEGPGMRGPGGTQCQQM